MEFLCTRVLFLFLVVAFSGVKRIYSAGTTGQKAHFQVEDKSGDLKITATKDLAKVTAQADSVQVVVKPGMAEYPVLKSDKPLVHVVNGVNGWNTLSFKKSSIQGKEKASVNSKYPAGGRRRNRNKGMTRKSKTKVNLHTSSTKIKSVLSAREKSSSQSKINPNPKKLDSRRKSYRLRLRKENKNDVQGSKKSDFQPGEVGFRVGGTAGKLNMDVTKNGTKVLSESGAVDVFLKRKPGSGPKAKQARNDVAARNADKIVHVAPELRNFNMIGLRKSIVPVKRRRTDKHFN